MNENENPWKQKRPDARAAYEAIAAATQSKARDDLPLPMEPMIAINSVLTSVPVISAGRLWDGDLLATYRRARAQVVATIAAGLRDAGLTDEATIERLTAAIVERLGEGA